MDNVEDKKILFFRCWFIYVIFIEKIVVKSVVINKKSSSDPIPRFWDFHSILKQLEFTQILHKKSAYISKLRGSQNSRIIRNTQNLRVIRVIRTLESTEFKNNQNS